MIALAPELRRQLQNSVMDARRKAEAAARKALHSLGVDEPDPPAPLLPKPCK